MPAKRGHLDAEERREGRPRPRALLYGDRGDRAGSCGVISSPRFESSDLTGLLFSWQRPGGDSRSMSLSSVAAVTAVSFVSSFTEATFSSSFSPSACSCLSPIFPPFRTATAGGRSSTRLLVGGDTACSRWWVSEPVGDGDGSGREKAAAPASESAAAVGAVFSLGDDCVGVTAAGGGAAVMSMRESSWIFAGMLCGSCWRHRCNSSSGPLWKPLLLLLVSGEAGGKRPGRRLPKPWEGKWGKGLRLGEVMLLVLWCCCCCC